MHFMVHVIYGLRAQGSHVVITIHGAACDPELWTSMWKWKRVIKENFSFSTDDNCLKKDYRSRQDSNLRGETPMDF